MHSPCREDALASEIKIVVVVVVVVIAAPLTHKAL